MVSVDDRNDKESNTMLRYLLRWIDGTSGTKAKRKSMTDDCGVRREMEPCNITQVTDEAPEVIYGGDERFERFRVLGLFDGLSIAETYKCCIATGTCP